MSSNGKAHVAPRPRFHPWPWALVAVFTVFFAVQFWMISFVSRGFEGPDDMQYYRHGLEYGKVVQQQKRQRELGWSLRTNLPTEVPAGQPYPLELTLADEGGAALAGARVDLKAGRPATTREDVRSSLAEAAPGRYSTAVMLAEGVWDLSFTVRHGGETVVEKVRVAAR